MSNNKNIRNILVLGGSGFVGRSVCERLVERSGGAGGRIVVPSRRPARAKHIQLLPTVQVVPADVFDEQQLAHAAADKARAAEHEDVADVLVVAHGAIAPPNHGKSLSRLFAAPSRGPTARPRRPFSEFCTVGGLPICAA